MAKKDDIEKVEFEIKWEGQPQGLWQRFLSMLHLNFTYYQITKDELIIKTGFLRQKVNTIELYLLKDPDYIARFAREKYLYSKSGEIIIRIAE